MYGLLIEPGMTDALPYREWPVEPNVPYRVTRGFGHHNPVAWVPIGTDEGADISVPI